MFVTISILASPGRNTRKKSQVQRMTQGKGIANNAYGLMSTELTRFAALAWDQWTRRGAQG
jgi:hypothetical protein